MKPDHEESFFDNVSRPQPFVDHGTGGTVSGIDDVH
jgi:hypothetical protein